MPEPDDLMLTLLKAIRTDIATIRSDMAEVKERLGLLEAGYSSVSRRVDRIGGEMETLNRRFDVAEATAAP
jgi:predicted nuclease with TOPRIM domain